MSDNILKCAVIGVGNMGKNHVRVYAQNSMIKLVAVADINYDLGQKVAVEFGIPYYKDFSQMIEIEKPDIVSVCVPTNFHYDVAAYCIQHN
ncbi:MAG: oxidoreductase protein, partial [uncultured bacterium]